MKFNENTAISTNRVLLVPYEARHVLRYHTWMEDEGYRARGLLAGRRVAFMHTYNLTAKQAIREATASERLALDEEYENQRSWRTSADKLTFIVCRPLPEDERQRLQTSGSGAIIAGEADASDRMVGDINLFLTPWDDDDDGAVPTTEASNGEARDAVRYCVGEVDIMIAKAADRGKGLGKAAVAALLRFVRDNAGGILAEYAGGDDGGQTRRFRMRHLLVRIKASNSGSIVLFRGLGFEQRGEVNYFGEIEMVLEEEGGFVGNGGGLRNKADGLVEGYREVFYDRSRAAMVVADGR